MNRSHATDILARTGIDVRDAPPVVCDCLTEVAVWLLLTALTSAGLWWLA